MHSIDIAGTERPALAIKQWVVWNELISLLFFVTNDTKGLPVGKSFVVSGGEKGQKSNTEESGC